MDRRTFVRAAFAFAVGGGAASAQTTLPTTRKSLTAEEAGALSFSCHDPSTIIRCKDEYWVFYTGFRVLSAHSKDLVHWEAGPVGGLFDAPAWVATTVPRNRRSIFWAPDVVKIGDQYFLYYSVSSWASQVSAIGLMTNPTLDPADPAYKWTDRGIAMQSRKGDTFNAIDPAMAWDGDGNLWMSFGSFWGGIKMVQLDPKTGRRISPESKIYSLAYHPTIEGSYVYRHGGYYYLLVNWGLCCRGIHSTYNIRVGRSEKITGPYLDKTGRDMAKDNGSLLLGSEDQFIGPGQAGIFTARGREWISFHYEADASKRATLAIRPLSWDVNGWPVVERNAT